MALLKIDEKGREHEVLRERHEAQRERLISHGERHASSSDDDGKASRVAPETAHSALSRPRSARA